jgi:hypothetical protein
MSAHLDTQYRPRLRPIALISAFHILHPAFQPIGATYASFPPMQGADAAQKALPHKTWQNVFREVLHYAQIQVTSPGWRGTPGATVFQSSINHQLPGLHTFSEGGSTNNWVRLSTINYQLSYEPSA